MRYDSDAVHGGESGKGTVDYDRDGHGKWQNELKNLAGPPNAEQAGHACRAASTLTMTSHFPMISHDKILTAHCPCPCSTLTIQV